MNSLDFIIAISILTMLFLFVQQYISPKIYYSKPFSPSYFLISTGSPGYWDVSQNYSMIGLSYLYKRGLINHKKFSELDYLLNNNSSKIKDLMGLSGKNITLLVRDYYNKSNIVYAYDETPSSYSNSRIYRWVSGNNSNIYEMELVVYS